MAHNMHGAHCTSALTPMYSPFRLPAGGGSGGSTATSRLHLGFLKGDDSTPEIKLSTEEAIVMCTLVCTADYCVDTTQQVLQTYWLAVSGAVWQQIDCSINIICTYFAHCKGQFSNVSHIIS